MPVLRRGREEDGVSVRVQATVWALSKHKGSNLIVLLCLADMARDDGLAWPGLAHIAVKCRLSRRQTVRVINELRESQELLLVRRGGGAASSMYRVNLPLLYSFEARELASGLDDAGEEIETSDVDVPGDILSPVTSGVGGVTSRALKVPPMSPEPLEPPQRQTSKEKKTAGAVSDERLFAVPETQVPPDETEANIAVLWAHYCGHFGDKLAIKTLTDARRKTLQGALKAADNDLEVLFKAVDGFKRYRDRKSGGTGVDDIFKSRPGGSSLTELIEFWCSQADDSPTMAASVPSVLRERVSRRRLAVVEALQRPGDAAAQQRRVEAEEWLVANAHERPVVEDGKVVRWERV